MSEHRTENELLSRMRDVCVDDPYMAERDRRLMTQAADEIERLTRERDEAEALAQSLQNRWAQRDLTIERLQAALEKICEYYGRPTVAEEIARAALGEK